MRTLATKWGGQCVHVCAHCHWGARNLMFTFAHTTVRGKAVNICAPLKLIKIAIEFVGIIRNGPDRQKNDPDRGSPLVIK